MDVRCARCQAKMACNLQASCWCADLPHGPMPGERLGLAESAGPAEGSGCLCPVCLCKELGCRIELLGKSAAELRALMSAFGESSYRGTQLYHSIYAARRFDFAGMSDLPASLRERLAAAAQISLPQVLRRYVSSDGSVRYLLSLPEKTSDGPSSAISSARVETVFMRSESRQTICISTQAGCA